MPGKKQVRLAFCDLAPDWDARDNYFTQALEHAGWEITFCNGPEEKPDFVLCGTFGFDFLKYDCCRIQFSGEDSWPDLNLYDYAMGFEVLDFDGRYLRLPLEKGVEYQLYLAAVNNFYPPSVEAGWVEENDFIDIAHGSAYYDGDATLIFAGTVVLREAD